MPRKLMLASIRAAAKEAHIWKKAPSLRSIADKRGLFMNEMQKILSDLVSSAITREHCWKLLGKMLENRRKYLKDIDSGKRTRKFKKTTSEEKIVFKAITKSTKTECKTTLFKNKEPKQHESISTESSAKDFHKPEREIMDTTNQNTKFFKKNSKQHGKTKDMTLEITDNIDQISSKSSERQIETKKQKKDCE
jgi:hypothetical protein